MSIDINQLTTEQLESLRGMYYSLKMMDEVKQINERIAYLEGWMSEEQESRYFAEHCAA